MTVLGKVNLMVLHSLLFKFWPRSMLRKPRKHREGEPMEQDWEVSPRHRSLIWAAS
jgi:hypothetical protein